MGKKLTVVLTGILVCMALVGCAADKSNRYEGAGMSFKYGPGWSIFYREADEDNHVIELYSEEGAGLSVVSCQRDISSVEEIYQGMISADQLLGQVSGMHTGRKRTSQVIIGHCFSVKIWGMDR